MTIDRASVEEGARLAAETRIRKEPLPKLNKLIDEERFHAHWNPEFAADLVRDLQRLWRVEEAMRWIAANGAEPLARSIANDALAVLANPAAEEGDG